MSFTIDADTAHIVNALNGLLRQTQNLQSTMQNIGEALTSNITQGIKDGESPWGTPYAPLKKPRRNGGVSDKPLNDTRQHIYNKITAIANNNMVRLGMLEESEIGATHQYGSTRKNIPARPFLPIRMDQVDLPSAWEREVVDILSRHFQA